VVTERVSLSPTPPQLGLPFSDKKIIPRNTEQDETDCSSVEIPPVSRKRKTSEFRSKPFLGREKLLEFHSEPFSDKKNFGIPFQTIFGREKPWNSVPTIFGREKNPEFYSEPFSEKKKLQNYVPNHFFEQKTHKNPFHTIFGNRKHSKKDHFC
jgi:hypothetical protein